MSDKLGDWLKEYDRYLDGEIEYQDLPPRPAPPPPVEAMTPADAKQLVDDAAAGARRSAMRFASIALVPVASVSVILFVIHAPWWTILGAQWAAALLFTKLYHWIRYRNDARSQEKRDPTLDETGKGRE